MKKESVDTSSLNFEKDEVIGLYFSAHWCPPCRGFTPKLVEFYKNVNKSAPKLKIIFVSSDRDQSSFDEYYGEMPWMALPFSERSRKDKLSGKCKVSGIPTLVLFDSEGNKLKTNGDVRALVAKDMQGADFPWPQRPVSELLTGKLTDKDGNESDSADLKGSVLGIYFSAHWCPPCRAFTPQLVDTYKKIKAKGHKFEIVFASSDQNEESFKEYLNTMPWKAIPLNDKSRKEKLSESFGVGGIPTLVILDADYNVITTDGRSSVSGDKNGDSFPWYPKPVNSLSDGAEKLNECPTLILFTDGTDEEVLENGKTFLLPVAEKLGQAAMPNNDEAELLFVSAGGDNDEDLCDRVRQFAKLPKADAKPTLLIILNIPEGNVYEHRGEVTSSDDVQRVVDDFMAGKLQFKELRQ